MHVLFQVVLLIASMATASFTPAATISGIVRARGADEAGTPASGGGNYDSRRYKFLERVDYDALRDFVVHVDRVSAPAPDGAASPLAVVTQRDGMFTPHVLPVLVGTEVEWPNGDDIFHNVFSVSDVCSFDLGLYRRGEAAKRTKFELPGRVDVFCSIHTKMSCIILVLPNPWFARTDDHSRYLIRDVPAGTYKLRAWHERLPAQIKEVTVPESGDVQVDFVLGFSRQARN